MSGIAYVKKVKNRHGQVFLYFRKKGHIRDGDALCSPWPDVAAGSSLELEVQALLGQEPVKPKVTNLLGAIRRYQLEDPRWAVLADSTKAAYRYYLAEFEDQMGDLAITAFKPSLLMDIQDAWALRGSRGAELRMNVLRNVLRPMFIARDLPDAFARLPMVPKPRKDKEPHRIWPEMVVETVIEACVAQKRFGIARAVALARYAGARRGDLVTLTRASRMNGRIAWRSGKKRVPVDQPEAAELSRWLDGTPSALPLSKWQAGQDRRRGVVRMATRTLVFNLSGDAYTDDGLGQELKKIVVGLHAEGKIDNSDYDLHGLRHTLGVELALAGATDAQGAAMLGHASPYSFAIYRRQASRMLLTGAAADLLTALRRKDVGTALEQAVTTPVETRDNPGPTVRRLRG